MLSKPLKGVRVVDMTIYGAGPACSRVLADWGADVIKVEQLGGEILRYMDANLCIPRANGTGPHFEIYNGNKRAISVNLKTEEGQEIMKSLLASADVFVSNMRLKALSQMGLDYESISTLYPKIVWAHLSGYGTNGPSADDPGFDTVAYWARAGKLVDFVEKDTSPMIAPIAVADLMAGPVLAGGISAALLQRKETGKGEKVTISLYGMSVWSLASMFLATQCGVTTYPKSRNDAPPFGNTYKCKDGEWIMMMMLDWRQFPAACKMLGLEEYVNDPRFSDQDRAFEHARVMVSLIDEKMLLHTAEEWDKIMVEYDIPHARLRHIKDILHDEQAKENHYIYPVNTEVGEFYLAAPPVQLGESAAPEHRAAPLIGEHTVEVLKESGYTDEQIQSLKDKKIIE